ncbi:MAG: flagellin lysine-N-methylase [Clostridia bacterium]|nr:flagellin lysine-N-methylase [Clostridia bacterium]
MLTVVPNYYTAFRCIGSRCRHNCCIGWEIDIDDTTLARYRALDGAWRQRFDAHVANDEVPHFITDESGRCPFLNAENLCDIQLELDDGCLCEICREHPRFHNRLPGRVESGLGLCCEEAARLILGQRELMHLCCSGTDEADDAILALRDHVIALLQDRTLSIPERCEAMLALCNTAMPQATPAEWARVLLQLERLDSAWEDTLLLLQNEWHTADLNGFRSHMSDRQTPYEQLLVYFVYRHFANADSVSSAAARACFAVLGYTVLEALGAVLFTKHGSFTFEQFCELARAFSAEVEYSDENLDILWDTLGGV